LRILARFLLAFAAVLTLANCATSGTVQSSRNAPKDVAAKPVEVSRASASPREVGCLAEAVYFEARGTGTTGESAVAHVVVNRAKSAKFSASSVCGVVADGCQFSYRCDGRSDALTDPNARARAYRVAETVLAGAPDITKGALFFHSARANPGWFNSRPRVGTFGGNIFYR
jgi:spore germination cell wall hydrolase CwlJ-like protein